MPRPRRRLLTPLSAGFEQWGVETAILCQILDPQRLCDRRAAGVDDVHDAEQKLFLNRQERRLVGLEHVGEDLEVQRGAAESDEPGARGRGLHLGMRLEQPADLGQHMRNWSAVV